MPVRRCEISHQSGTSGVHLPALLRLIKNEDTCPPTGRFSYLGRVDCQFFDEPFNRASNLALVTAYSSKRR
jgi:hypothetical protein